MSSVISKKLGQLGWTIVSESTINKLLTYIEFVCTQQKQLLFIENEKITIKNEFFKQEKKVLKTKKNKDKEIPNIINTSWIVENIC